ncbi:ThiF family adenylyltransferase [Georgenia subflava]|uniref:Adenylyltransferase/sulfurtransferase MoeZ n=1 Tax=Georgenia subflava TaxID=1622177 RepID=A0A6N7EP45_9MICO|nr:ThiF family adenylyltransferase [Georgenia subflava]MPV37004.1 adenylyltransferase/sulfurtransferase MoeZ [Georgenia subflava]
MRLLPLVDPGPPLTREQVQRYSRHLLLCQLGDVGQRRLLAARVLVMGAGGLGSPALQYLAAAGVGRIGIVDDDVVDASNLQRQVIHSLADVGRPKVDSAAEQIAGLNPDVEVIRHHLRLDAANAHEILAGYDLVLDGTDNFPTRYLVNDVCAELGIPLVWASILRFDAQVAVFWSRPRPAAIGPDGAASGPAPVAGRTGGAPPSPDGAASGDTTSPDDGAARPAGVTLRDLFPTPPPEGTTPSCGQAGVLGAMCGQVGSIMAAEAVKLITGTGEPLLGRVLVLDVLAARWSELPVRPRAGAHAPASLVELGYDPAGSPPGSPAAALCAVPGSTPPAATALPVITVRTLAQRLAARERGSDDFVLLDVREVPERSIVTIPGAVSIPLAEVLADPESAVHRLDLAHPGGVARELVVHCRSGQRSAQAVRALTDAGARAVNVEGGVLAWVADIDPTLPTY